jgi:hypothetical protein
LEEPHAVRVTPKLEKNDVPAGAQTAGDIQGRAEIHRRDNVAPAVVTRLCVLRLPPLVDPRNIVEVRTGIGVSLRAISGRTASFHTNKGVVPDRERERVKHAYWQALDEAISEQDGKRWLQALVDQLDSEGFTAAPRCLADDLDALVVHLRYPLRHRRRWRSTNLLERSLGEVKRRTKVMGRVPGETSCLTLVWAMLDLLITHQTNGIHFNALDRQRLKRARYQGNDQTISEKVTAA